MDAYRRPAAVLVDLDNTLHNYDAAARAARDGLARKIAALAGVSPTDALSAYLAVMEGENAAGDRSGIDMRIRRLNAVASTLNVELPVDALAEDLGRMLVDNALMYAGATEALAALARCHSIMILTEGHADTQQPIANKLGLSGFPLFATRSHGVLKSDSSAYALAIRNLALQPNRVLMIGDDWDCDVLGAARVGLWQLWISHERQRPSAAGDRFLGSLPQFRDAPAFLSDLERVVR